MQAQVPLKKLVDDALRNLAKVIKDKQIRVEVAIAPDLQVVTDERKLTQIVRNLLNNAVFYNRLAGHVTITAQVVEGHLSLAVADTGIGIPETEQARILNASIGLIKRAVVTMAVLVWVWQSLVSW